MQEFTPEVSMDSKSTIVLFSSRLRTVILLITMSTAKSSEHQISSVRGAPLNKSYLR